VREIRTLRATWRGLETGHGREACRRASPRPYLGARGGEIPPRDSRKAVLHVREAEQDFGVCQKTRRAICGHHTNSRNTTDRRYPYNSNIAVVVVFWHWLNDIGGSPWSAATRAVSANRPFRALQPRSLQSNSSDGQTRKAAWLHTRGLGGSTQSVSLFR
jgi:hypothetical protein